METAFQRLEKLLGGGFKVELGGGGHSGIWMWEWGHKLKPKKSLSNKPLNCNELWIPKKIPGKIDLPPLKYSLNFLAPSKQNP